MITGVLIEQIVTSSGPTQRAHHYNRCSIRGSKDNLESHNGQLHSVSGTDSSCNHNHPSQSHLDFEDIGAIALHTPHSTGAGSYPTHMRVDVTDFLC